MAFRARLGIFFKALSIGFLVIGRAKFLSAMVLAMMVLAMTALAMTALAMIA
jgi:hypothetical protein